MPKKEEKLPWSTMKGMEYDNWKMMKKLSKIVKDGEEPMIDSS